ncbi:hypothetical protein ACFE04_022283 [Oxalis oulophora]
MSATVISSSPLVQFHSETTTTPTTPNGQSSSLFHYPTARAKYEDIVRNPDLFWEVLNPFNQAIGIKVKVPTVAGKTLDLYQLFVEVTSRGGLEKIIKDRKWKEVILAFRFPNTITSASFVLRKFYISLLYDFEQVYFLGRQSRPISSLDNVNDALINGSGSFEESAYDQGISTVQGDYLVNGVIDGKFDGGYLVTVNLGSEMLKGVLYHVPSTHHVAENSQAITPHVLAKNRRHRKRVRLAAKDPFRPKSNRSGYNFFFAEHYGRLKPEYQGQEKMIGKAIGQLWNNLSEAEKQVYQEQGAKDKERYRSELREYKASIKSATQLAGTIL